MVQLPPPSLQKPEYLSGDTAWGQGVLCAPSTGRINQPPLHPCVLWGPLPAGSCLLQQDSPGEGPRWEGVQHASVSVGLMMGGLQWGEASPMFWHHEQHGARARSRMQKRNQAREVKQPLCSVLL